MFSAKEYIARGPFLFPSHLRGFAQKKTGLLILPASFFVPEIPLYCIYLIFFVILLKLNSDEYKSTSNAIGSLMVLTLSIYYLINFSVKSTGSESIMSPNFLIVVALMLNVSSTLFVSLISNNLTESELSKYWYITNIAVIGTNILISIAFVMQKYRKIPSPNGNQNVDFTFPDDR